MTASRSRPWPLGVEGVARLLGVGKDTVVTWRRRSRTEWVHVPRFPDPDGSLSGRDGWWPDTIEKWARDAGRWPHGDRTAAEVLADQESRSA